MVLKLYVVSEGPPSLAVRQLLVRLGLKHELVSVDYNAGEHMTPQYALMNPQKEVPVLDDDGFFLSESNAIMQYICDKYAPSSPLYPQDPKARAIVNHRLSFNLSTYYANISAYTLAPIFYNYKPTSIDLKKVNMALDVFETYMERLGTSHAAADHLTIADFQLVNTNMTLELLYIILCLEAINFDFSQFKRIQKWYDDFKKNYPDLWNISADAMNELQHLAANPPDLSHLYHPAREANK